MKKLLTVMTAFVMALTMMLSVWTAARAEDASGGKAGLATDVTITVNPDTFLALAGGGSEDAAAMLKPLMDLFNNLGIHVVVDGSVSEATLKLKDTVLTTIGIMSDENGIKLETDLLPGYILTADPTAMMNMGSTAGTGSSAISLDALNLTAEEQLAMGTAVGTHIAALQEKLNAGIGEAETGNWTFDEVEFTEKKALSMSTKELLTTVLTSAKDLLTDPALSKVVSSLGEQVSPEKLDEILASIEKQDEAELPVLAGAIYSNNAENKYFDIDLTKTEETIKIGLGTFTDKLTFLVDAANQVKVAGTIGTLNGTVNLAADINSNGMMLQAAFEGQPETDGSYAGSVKIAMMGNDLLTLGFRSGPTDEVANAKAFDNADATVIALDKLAEDQAASQQLSTLLMTSIPSLLAKVQEAMPEAAAILMQLMAGTMQQQQPTQK